jgi:hypothetical protein
MHKTFKPGVLISVMVMAVQCTAAQNAGGISPALKADLTSSRGVFVVPVQTHGKRKPPLETWFVYRDGAIYISTSSTDPRVRSIATGEPQATISIGTADGPSFTATGSIINDRKVHEAVLSTLQTKYPDLWRQYGGSVRYGLTSGMRVLIKYTPADS